MKLSPGEQESIVALLTRIYLDIRDIEEEFQLLAGEQDFRPRIEHFHDAVRAFSGKNPQECEPGGRLAVELLAYDLSCLRYVQSMPLSSFKPHGTPLSPRDEVIKMDQGLAIRPKRADRATRDRLSDLYQHYAVLFAALLKPFADADYQGRSDDFNRDVQEINNIIQHLDMMMKQKVTTQQLAAAVHHIEDDQIRNALLAFMQQERYKNKNDIKKLVHLLKQEIAKKDKSLAAVSAAHMNFVVTQFSIFDDSKDLLKKMAERGMNLVGKFVEASMAQTRREMGR